jgi:hypothetical protein
MSAPLSTTQALLATIAEIKGVLGEDCFSAEMTETHTSEGTREIEVRFSSTKDGVCPIWIRAADYDRYVAISFGEHSRLELDTADSGDRVHGFATFSDELREILLALVRGRVVERVKSKGGENYSSTAVIEHSRGQLKTRWGLLLGARLFHRTRVTKHAYESYSDEVAKVR